MKKSDLTTIFSFGQYKGKTIPEAIASGLDPAYLVWAFENVKGFKDSFSDEFVNKIYEFVNRVISTDVGDMMSSTNSYFNGLDLDPTIF